MRILVLLFGLVLGSLCNSAGASEILRFYVSPTGADTNSGLSREQAVKTLQAAEYKVRSQIAKSHQNIEVLIAPGTYYGQSVKWYAWMPNHTITIRADTDRPNQYAVFDGRNLPADTISHTDNFFRFSAIVQGEKTNIHLQRLWIRYYQGGVTFSGQLHNPNGGNSANSITNCIFQYIGDKYWDDPDGIDIYSYSAVGLQNSHGNLIENNTFQYIEGNQSTLHAIYAIQSRGNTIRHNRFHSGLHGHFYPIKLRDESHNNIVEKNEFNSGRAAVLDWFCNPLVTNCYAVNENFANTGAYCTAEQVQNCTSGCCECPSYNNRLRDNNIKIAGMTEWHINGVSGGVTEANSCKKNFSGERIIAEGSQIPLSYHLIISNIYGKSTAGFCPKYSDCINSNGACFADGYGANTHYACRSNHWYKCEAKTLGEKLDNLTCTLGTDGIFRWQP